MARLIAQESLFVHAHASVSFFGCRRVRVSNYCILKFSHDLLHMLQIFCRESLD